MFNTDQIKIVSTFHELITTVFEGKNNALCWQRSFDVDFKEIVNKLQLKEHVTDVSIENILSLQLSEKGCLAREIIINDMKLLEQFGAQPTLNLIEYYDRDEDLPFISTDVYSYHVDRSEILIDTFLCTYHGASSDIIPNDQVDQKILIPEIREQLRALFSGPEDEFDIFLQENFFDLHYHPKSNAEPINLGLSNLWRLAVDHPDQPVLPCVHRAPIEKTGELRLMLIC